MKKILVLRFSALGDIALLAPVIASLVRAHPDVEVTVATRAAFAPLFTGLDRVQIFPADLNGKHSGFFGLRSLFRSLVKRTDFDCVIDVHDHLRTIILRSMFRLFGLRVFVFDKGRKEKRAFTRKENKVTAPLPTTVRRYQEVFERAGFSFQIINPPFVFPGVVAKQNSASWIARHPNLTHAQKWIGIAPFAAHFTKIWPLENYEELMRSLLEKHSHIHLLLFGSKTELNFFNSIQRKFPEQCTVVAGELTLEEELFIMQKLALMITVDSANMHLAGLVGIPILSIWGGTHPDVGFVPVSPTHTHIIQISRDELPCRPCSVYGKEVCFRGDFACMTRISPQDVAARAMEIGNFS